MAKDEVVSDKETYAGTGAGNAIGAVIGQIARLLIDILFLG